MTSLQNTATNAAVWPAVSGKDDCPSSLSLPSDPATAANLASSSVSSPSAHDVDCAEVDELLEGIDRVRIDDLWTTPRSAAASPGTAPFRAGLFAPPSASGIAAISRPPSLLRSKPLSDILAAEPGKPAHPSLYGRPSLPRTYSEPGRCRELSHLPRTQSSVSSKPEQHPSSLADPSHDFPTLFKVYPCPSAAECYAAGAHSECFYYHAVETDRRRAGVNMYRPHMCRFVEEAGGCRKGDRCPFAHNDFERRYHPDRFGKETCRDYLRGDCPRRYCTFRHEVSDKVENAIDAIDEMTDKELLQLVLKLSDARGRALSEKLVRRFGHGKKHSGWKLEGFNTRGRDDQKVKFVTARVEQVKKRLRAVGERKWASSLKTTSLRDMMSGVRKVAEEIRERCYKTEEHKAEMGPETQRLIRAVFSNTNWSCHSQDGDNPFVVTPDNQNDAMTALERLVEKVVNNNTAATGDYAHNENAAPVTHAHNNNKTMMQNATTAHAHFHVDTYYPMMHGGSGGSARIVNGAVDNMPTQQQQQMWR